MAQPYVGEIRMFGGNFAPVGWMFCAGQLLPINQYETLFNLIGTTYGGDGQNTFALPDLRGRVVVHQGTGFVMGQFSGTETVTLTTAQIPQHNHPYLSSTNPGAQQTPTNNVTGKAAGNVQIYRQANPGIQMAANMCGSSGGSQPHENMQPYLCISFIISLFGIYPTQS
jgi:microcystin-dependent protein